MGSARARAVSARSCADIPVVVPIQIKDYYLRLTVTCLLTILIIHSDGIGCTVAILVLFHHHRKLKSSNTLRRQSDAYVPTGEIFIITAIDES